MGQRMQKFKPSLITAALVASGLAFASQPLYAQDAPAPEADASAEQEIERIEVRGFSTSLIQSLNQKRFGDTVSEQLSADDLGGLPDVSMADAYQTREDLLKAFETMYPILRQYRKAPVV